MRGACDKRCAAFGKGPAVGTKTAGAAWTWSCDTSKHSGIRPNGSVAWLGHEAEVRPFKEGPNGSVITLHEKGRKRRELAASEAARGGPSTTAPSRRWKSKIGIALSPLRLPPIGSRAITIYRTKDISNRRIVKRKVPPRPGEAASGEGAGDWPRRRRGVAEARRGRRRGRIRRFSWRRRRRFGAALLRHLEALRGADRTVRSISLDLHRLWS